MTARTRSRTGALTQPVPLTTLDTVLVLTPTRSATSARRTRGMGGSSRRPARPRPGGVGAGWPHGRGPRWERSGDRTGASGRRFNVERPRVCCSHHGRDRADAPCGAPDRSLPSRLQPRSPCLVVGGVLAPDGGSWLMVETQHRTRAGGRARDAAGMQGRDDDVVLSLDGVTHVFETEAAPVRAVDDVSAAFRRGTWTAIMGPSGSGKSTLLYCAAGLIRATAGRILLDGVDVRAASERRLTALRRQRLGFVFQDFNLVPALTAEQNVGLPARFDGRPAADDA